MRLALVIYTAFLLIEGGLAWLVSGNPFLLAAVICGLLFYATVWKRGGPWGEVVRAVAAGMIAVAGPLYYRASLLPTLLCFLALPHLLATTQCFWEIALGKDPAQQNARMRTVVFTVAFYAAMGLVFVLLRGTDEINPWITTPLAVLVLVLAIPAWDLARVTRLRAGRSSETVPLGLKARRIVLVLAVLGGIAALFTGVLPAAAEKLCAISPRWKLQTDSPANLPPHGDKPAPAPTPSGGAAQRPGLENSAITGKHQLPLQSDIKATGATMLYLRPHQRTQAIQMSHGEVYVRSHTLDNWKDNDGAWVASVQGGQWLEDAADGQADGVVTLTPTATGAIPHTIFLQNADGYSLPALQNVIALSLPRVYRLPGDIHQMQATGDIRYDALSTPRNWDTLPNRELLRTGHTGNPPQLRTPASLVLMEIISSDVLLDKEKATTLSQQVGAVNAWLAKEITYSTVMKGDPNLTPLDNFLVGERRGYCDFYASAGALMLRFYGIPTRVAYGYASNSYDERDGIFTFTDESAHAWTEVFIEDLGWTICDFTPPGNIGHLGAQPQKPKPPFDEKAFAEHKEKPPGKNEEKKPEAFSLSAWWRDTLAKISAMDPMEQLKQTITWLAGAAVLCFLLQLLRKKKAKSGQAGDSFAGDEKQSAYFAEFLRVFQQAGLQRRQGSTPREYLGTVRRHGLTRGEFDPMMDYHYARRYGDAAEDRAREEEFLATARETEARLRRKQET